MVILKQSAKIVEQLWHNAGAWIRIKQLITKFVINAKIKMIRKVIMKINSNTISLEREEYAAVEEVIKKIASENKIENISEVRVVLSADSGMIKFKQAEGEDMGDGKEPITTEEAKKSVEEDKAKTPDAMKD